MAVGMLSYLQVHTQPDISMAVHQTSRFFNDPRLSHEKASMGLVRYLFGTRTRGIVYNPNKSKGLKCYVDADFTGGWTQADSDNAENVMSQTGYVIAYAVCPINCVSKLQTEIALSIAEAEYIALSQSLRELIPLMNFLEEINKTFPILLGAPNFICTVHKDNQYYIKMAKSPKFSPRTKHIALKYHHFRSFVKFDRVIIKYCRTEMQKADLLTKPLNNHIFFRLYYMLLG